MLAQRIITAVILAPLMLAGIFLLPLNYFSVFIGAIVLLGAWEWGNLSGLNKTSSRLTYVMLMAVSIFLVYLSKNYWPGWARFFLISGMVWWLIAIYLVRSYPSATSLWSSRFVRLLMGFFILIPMWVGFYLLKSMPNNSLLILLLMLLIWGADIGAYFAGVKFGNRKLAPDVSPGKTWAGVFGGLGTCYLIALVTGLAISFTGTFTLTHWLWVISIVSLVVVISILGDLVESMVKRHRGIKDSSHLLPGHGGVMDRIDSMSAAVPIYALALSLSPLV